MSEWNPVEMNALFEEKAKEQGYSFRSFVEKFANEVGISRSTLQRYLTDKEPKKYDVKKALYEKIEKELGYSMLEQSPTEVVSEDIFVEDRDQKVSEFCQIKLEEIFEQIHNYLKEVYNGSCTLLFERDSSRLLLYCEWCRPCMPNYLVHQVLKFFELSITLLKKEARKEGIIVFDGVGFFYEWQLVDGKIKDEDDYELEEDYIDNNMEEHRTRILDFMKNFVEFWSKKVERLYPNGTGKATELLKQFTDSTC